MSSPARGARSVLLLVLAAVPMLALASWSHGAQAASVSISASEDAYTNSTRPTRNYGTASKLRVDLGPAVLRTYVKFAVPSEATNVSRATLRLRLASQSSSGIRIGVVDPSSWTEATITAANAPPSGASLGVTGSGASGTWVQLDVTSAVAGKTAVSFVLSDPTMTAVAISSRETADPPRLVVETASTPSSTTTTTPSTTTTTAPGSPAPATNTIRAAFYYPWFPEAWKQQGYDPFTWYTPSLGWYANDDVAVLAKHVEMMRSANLNSAIASWWGQGTPTDGRVRSLLDASGNTGFKWTLYYEREGTSDPTVDQIRADLAYIRQSYTSHPAFMTRGGKPVLFVYAGPTDGCSMADRWATANNDGGFQIVLKVFSGYRTCASQPPLWHQYGPAVSDDSQAGYSYSISPGFWKRSEATPRLVRDPARFTTSAQAMVASNAPLQLVTTFNEWGEGTSVEPAVEWASPSGLGTYLDILSKVLPASVYVDGTPPPPTTTTTVPPTTTAPTATIPTDDPVIAAAGDIACDPASGSYNGGLGTSTQCRQAATAGLLDPSRLAAVLTLGDNQYEDGALAKYQQSYGASWGALQPITRPAPGNHEYLTAGAAGYYAYFGAAAGDPAKGYYSWDVGAWHMVVINSNCSAAGGCGKGSPQETWLRADLAAHPSACTLAYWHHPRFSSGEHGDTAAMAPIWQALVDGGADVVLSGHDHDYERFTPMLADGTADVARGIRQFVVGTGGKNSYAFKGVRAGSEAQATNLYGVLELALHANSYDFRFVPAPGSTFTDKGSQTCH